MIRRGPALLPAALVLLALPRPLAAGAPAGQAFVPVPGCRAVDTRGPAGPNGGPALAAGETRILTLTGACGVPTSALGLAVNVTAVSPAAAGFTELYPGDLPSAPGTTVLNFNAGTTRAGNAMVALASDASGTVKLGNGSTGATDYLIDILGYWIPACTATITVTNPGTTSGTVTVPFSQTFTSSGGTGTMTYTTASPLPAGLALAANGTLAGTPTQSGTFPIVVVATDANGCTGAGATYTLVIACQTITVTNPGVTTGTVNVPFSQTFTQTGGVGTTTFSTASPLPNGLSLASNGVLAGTPTQSGGFPIVVVATDADGCTGTGASYLLVINCPPVVVSITPTPAQVCSASAGNTASATPGFSSYAWSITNGTIQGSTTGASITYTAGAGGNVALTVAVMDAAACPGQTTLNVPITAIPSPPAIAASNPQSFTVSGAAGTFTLTFGGQTTAPLAFNATAAAVQAALGALSSIGGVGGTVAVSQAGPVYTVAFGATLAGPQPSLTAAGAGGCTVAVDPPAVCADSTGNLARGPAGATSWAWVITNGTITSATNVQTITYTAGPSGTVTLGLTVTNPGGCSAQNTLDVTINAVPATPAITPTPSPVCGNSTGNTASGPAGATTYAWSITNGTITSATDIQTITYTAGPSGSVTLDLSVTNASGCQASNSLDVPVNAAPATPTITPTPAALCANTSGNGASGPAGATTYAWSITNGTITSATNTQTITYTAGASGNVGLTLVVTNANGCSASNTVNVPINPIPAFTPAAGALPTATYNTADPLTFSGTNGTAPYSFLVTSGALPPGMTLTSGGTVTPNVPTATGAFSFSITVTDAKGCSSTQAYTLNVQPNLQPDAYSGVGNTQLFVAGVAGAPATPAVSSLSATLANDTPAGGIVVTAGTTACGGIGGSLTIDSLGRFIYTPPLGAAGLAVCTYTGTSNTIAATGAINITLTGMVWYVNNSGGSDSASRGRSHEPLSTIAQAVTNASANQTLFLHTGSSAYAGASLNKAGLTLWGQGTTFTLGPLTIASGSKPTLDSTLTLAANTLTVSSLDVSTGSSTGVTNSGAITGATVQNGVTVTTTTGTAVSLNNAGGAFTFQSVSANGGSRGIFLTSTTGSFTVTGNGGNCTTLDTTCTGGTLQNMAGGDDSSASPGGTAVVLNGAQNVSLTRVRIRGNSNYGIRGTSVAGFVLDNSLLDGVTGTNAATPFNDGCVSFDNLTGTATVSNSNIQGGLANNFRLVNTSGTLNRITFSSVTFDVSGANPTNDALTIESQNAAVVNVTVQNSFFRSAAGDLFQLNNIGTGADDLVFTGNALTNANSAIATGGGGVTIGSSGTGNVTSNFSNNTLRDAVGHAILFFKSTGAASVTGTFDNNVIGVSGVANSGSAEGDGIKVQNAGQGTVKATITNNQIRQYNVFGIELLTGGGATLQSGALNATITGNTIAQPGNTVGTLSLPKNGIHVNDGTVPGDTYLVCADIGGAGALANTMTGSGADGVPTTGGAFDFRLRQRQSTTLRLPNYGGVNSDNAAAVAFVSGNNGGASGIASNTVPTGGGFTGGAGSCP